MKYALFILLNCTFIFASAQSLTELQKQEALQCATKFCNLMVRYSNGERLINAQINAICSGANCSAYDNVKGNNETTLQNYLIAIQKVYPDKLQMEITAPSLSNSKTYLEYEFDNTIVWGKTKNNDASILTAIPASKANKIVNTYMIFDVVQIIPSLQIRVSRKLIYDFKVRKITAFIENDGAFMSFLNANIAFSKKDYRTAIELYSKASQNNRTAFKRKCNEVAMNCAWLINDYNLAAIFADKAGKKLEAAEFKAIGCMDTKGDYEKAYPYIREIETKVEQVKNEDYRCNLYILLGEYYAASPYNHDGTKAINYLKKADDLGSQISGYLIWWFGTYDDAIDLSSITKEQWIEYLMSSARRGFPTSYFIAATIEEYEYNNIQEAAKWYEKSAIEAENPLGMACLGKILCSSGNVEQGKKWLRKSLEGRVFEAFIEDYKNQIGVVPWPQSRTDVEGLLNKYDGDAIYSNQSSITNLSTENYNSLQTSSTTSTTYSDSNISHYSYRSEFNEAKDSYWGGLSAGYVQKQWVYDIDNEKVKVDAFGELGHINGVQFGIRIDPQFKYGFGINTGLYYEYYFDKSEDMYEGDIEYYYRMEEHSLYLPVHLKYSLNFSKWFQLALYGGIGLDYGVSGKIYLRSDGETIENQGLYDEGLDIKRFNASLDYGAAIRVSRFQLNFTMSKGLVNMADSEEYKVKQNKMMNIALSVYF